MATSDIQRVISVLDALMPWAVRGVVEHPYSAGLGRRAIGMACDLRRELTGESVELPDAAALEQTELDQAQMEVESSAEWIAEVLYLGHQMLECRQAGQDDEALYRRLETFVSNPPKFNSKTKTPETLTSPASRSNQGVPSKVNLA